MLDVDQQTLDRLLAEDQKFKYLYDKHSQLNRQVDKAGRGELALSDDALHEKKKEKLALKDEMMDIIHRYTQG